MLLCLVGPVLHRDLLIGSKEGADCFAFLLIFNACAARRSLLIFSLPEPCVRPSTFFKDISSEVLKPISFHISHIASIRRGNELMFFFFFFFFFC